MTFRRMFRQMLSERRDFAIGSPDYEWRTEAAKKYLLILRGIPTIEWNKR